MRDVPELRAAPTFWTATATAAAFDSGSTFAATAGYTHVLRSLEYSYDDTNTGGITVSGTVGGAATTLFQIDTVAAEVRQLLFPGGIYGDVGTALTIAVGAADATDTAFCNAKVYTMDEEPERRARATFFHHGPAANTAATTGTIAANAQHTHVLDWLCYSFDSATNKITTVTVTINAVTAWQVSLVAGFAGPGFVEFPGGLYGSKNQAMVVTLLADDGGASGKLNVRYH